MNQIICKYVNGTTVFYNTRKLAKSQIISKEFSQTTTDLRHTLDFVANKLKFTTLNDWYKLPTKVLATLQRMPIESKDYPKHFGDQFQKDFNASPIQLLSSVFPEHEWLPWKFERCPNGFWDDSKNQRDYIHWVAKQLSIKNNSDWYDVKNKVKINKTFPLC